MIEISRSAFESVKFVREEEKGSWFPQTVLQLIVWVVEFYGESTLAQNAEKLCCSFTEL